MTDAPTATEDPVAPEPAPEPELLHGAPVTRRRNQRSVHVGRDELVGLVRTLRDEGWLQCLDVTGVDYLAHPQSDLPDGIQAERFEVVVTLISHAEHERLGHRHAGHLAGGRLLGRPVELLDDGRGVEGEVGAPGVYQLLPGETLRALLVPGFHAGTVPKLYAKNVDIGMSARRTP